jgi:hypothetical protein
MAGTHLKVDAVEPRAEYVASGQDKSFLVPFTIFQKEHIEVFVNRQAVTTGFTVTQYTHAEGGAVNFAAAPPAGASITIRRRLPIGRIVECRGSSAGEAAGGGDDLDYLTAALQDVATEAGRSVRLSPADPTGTDALVLPVPAERRNKLLGFDAAGNLVATQATAATGGPVTWGAIGGTVADQADLKAALDGKAAAAHAGAAGTAHPAATAAAAGFMAAADKAKLDGIEAAATADQTAAEIEALLDARYGNTTWRASGAAAAGSEGSVQVKSGSNLVGDTSLTYDPTSLLLKASNVALRVTRIGAVSGTWNPPVGASAGQTLLVSASGDLTIGLPTGFTPPGDHEFFVHLRLTNTGAQVIKVTYSAYAIRGYSGPSRKIAPGAAQDYWLATVDGGATWEIIGGAHIPSPITFWDPGTPNANAVIWSQYIFNPTRVPFDATDIGTVTCATAPSAPTEFLVCRTPRGTSTPQNIAKVTFSANNKWSAWALWSGSAWVAPSPANVVEFVKGDILSIESPANLNGLVGLRWIMMCAEREDQS